MTVLVLIGPPATEPVELGRRVASGREFTAFVDVAGLVRSLAGVRGIDAESRHFLGVDMATGIADRLAADGVDVVIAEAVLPPRAGLPRRAGTAGQGHAHGADR